MGPKPILIHNPIRNKKKQVLNKFPPVNGRKYVKRERLLLQTAANALLLCIWVFLLFKPKESEVFVSVILSKSLKNPNFDFKRTVPFE
jgi:hypothetical protein